METLSTYDPDFSKAWVDGRIYQGFNHEEALKNVKCPVLLLHANWFRHQQYGLVGAMDDEDAARVCAITNCHYIRVDSEHVIHTEQPRIFIHRVEEFVKNNLDD